MKTTSLAFGLAAALFTSAAAFADGLPPPAVTACDGKKVNDACTTQMQSGTCIASKCTKNDYSDGSPPGVLTYDCLECKASGSKGGCAVEDAAASSLGAWAIALIPFGAIALIRRRNQKRR